MKLLLEICYDGTAYNGYQVQPNGITIQQTLQAAAEKAFALPLKITGCSRTDSGVHARQFFCTVEGDRAGQADDNEPIYRIPLERIPEVLNIYLPKDIAVKSARFVPDTFHPRYAAKEKEYEYLILNAKTRNPFYENRAWHIDRPLDTELMNEAAQILVGTHDFAAFMASGSKIIDTVRTIKYCKVTRDCSIIKVQVAADGFLYNMVRIIVGTLVAVSDGKISLPELREILETKKRSVHQITAPPYGLYLNKVVYEEKE